jgi:hypothetical protein
LGDAPASYDRPVQLRRGLIAFALALAVVTAITAASAPRDDDESSPPAPAPSRPVTAPAVELAFRHPVEDAPPERSVRNGSHVIVRVQSGIAGNVEIPELGLIEPVEPGTPAVFDLLASRSGRYEIALVSVAGERTRLGTLVVGD